MIPPAATIHELETACAQAKDLAAAFSDAVKSQAEKYQLDPQGLAKYIRARVNDKVDKLRAEQGTLAQFELWEQRGETDEAA